MAQDTLKKSQQDVLNFKKKKGQEEGTLEERLNMHFLFNSLTSVANLSILEGAVQTNEMVTLLAEFLRNSFFYRNDYWTVEREVANIECYLRIQSVRFGARITYHLDVSRRIWEAPVPALMLVPFIEYAVDRSINNHKEGGTLWLKGEREGTSIIFTIKDISNKADAGDEMPHKKLRSSYSLEKNIAEMKTGLTREYGKCLEIEEIPLDQGGETILRLPWQGTDV